MSLDEGFDTSMIDLNSIYLFIFFPFFFCLRFLGCVPYSLLLASPPFVFPGAVSPLFSAQLQHAASQIDC